MTFKMNLVARRLSGEAREGDVLVFVEKPFPILQLVVHQRVERIDDDGAQTGRRIANEVVKNRNLKAARLAAARAGRDNDIPSARRKQ